MQRFWRDDRGTYAVMAGIVTLPLLLGVGTAVDYSVGVLNQKELQSVLDSAVLAGEYDEMPTYRAFPARTAVSRAPIVSSSGVVASMRCE